MTRWWCIYDNLRKKKEKKRNLKELRLGIRSGRPPLLNECRGNTGSGISQPTFSHVVPDVSGGIIGLSQQYIKFTYTVGEQTNKCNRCH